VSETVRINATLDRELLTRIDAFARERLEDRSTAIRQLVDLALRELSKRQAVEAYRQGRATLREVARALDLDLWKAQDLLMAEGVAVSQGSRSETADALDAVVADSR
jgi:metal-responsive CopG/Arc/MetJ family transcriptional regulator